ncbi:hypothetical protein BKA70DRAFT_1129390, partial [Coprinopsis sp. MPI-PUGE-AT-0042]
MTIAGCTQYRTRVQGMPNDVLKHFQKMSNDFMWDDGSPMVGIEHARKDRDVGGLKSTDLGARNEAINLMRLQAYLRFGQDRPRWAFLADQLLAKNIPQRHKVDDPGVALNMFLQSWEATTRTDRSKAPWVIRQMVKSAKDYNVTFLPQNPSDLLRRSMPIWHHLGLAGDGNSRRNSSHSNCLRTTHEILTV